MSKFFGYVLTMGVAALIFSAGISLFIYTIAGVVAGAVMVAGFVNEVSWPTNLTLIHVGQFAAVLSYVFGLIGLIVGFFIELDCQKR